MADFIKKAISDANSLKDRLRKIKGESEPKTGLDLTGSRSQSKEKEPEFEMRVSGLLEYDEKLLNQHLPNFVAHQRAGLTMPGKGAMANDLKAQGFDISRNQIKPHRDYQQKDAIPDDLRGADRNTNKTFVEPNPGEAIHPQFRARMQNADNIAKQKPGRVTLDNINYFIDGKEKELEEIEANRFPFMDLDESKFKQTGRRTGGASSTRVKESASLYAFHQMMNEGKKINQEDMEYYIKSYAERYNLPENEMKDLANSVMQQTSALEKWLDSKGISSNDRKDYRFARVEGTDTDIPDEYLIDGDPLNEFNTSMKEFLGGKDGMLEMFEAEDMNAWNPSDVYAMRNGIPEEFKAAYQGVFDQFSSQDMTFEDKENAIRMIAAKMRDLTNKGSMIPISLKDTAGDKAKAEETNYGELDDEGIHALQMAMLGNVGLHMNLQNEMVGSQEGMDFNSNGLEIPVAMKMMAHYLNPDGEGEESPFEIYAKYYLLAQTKAGADWRQFKNEPKPLKAGGRDGTTGTKEKFGMIPTNFLANQISELGQGLDEGTAGHIPTDADGSHMMGLNRRQYQDPGEYTGARYPIAGEKPVQGPRQTDASYQKKLDAWQEKKDREGQPKPSKKYNDYLADKERAGTDAEGYDYGEFGDDEIKYWSEMLEEMHNYNQEQDGKDDFERFNVDMSNAQIGDKKYGMGEGEFGGNYQDFMRDLFEESRNVGDVGDFQQKLRLFLNRVRVAHGMGRMHKNGDLQKYMATNLLKAKKQASSANKPGFPFLKIGVDPQIDPKDVGLKEGLKLRQLNHAEYYQYTLCYQ